MNHLENLITCIVDQNKNRVLTEKEQKFLSALKKRLTKRLTKLNVMDHETILM